MLILCCQSPCPQARPAELSRGVLVLSWLLMVFTSPSSCLGDDEKQPPDGCHCQTVFPAPTLSSAAGLLTFLLHELGSWTSSSASFS